MHCNELWAVSSSESSIEMRYTYMRCLTHILSDPDLIFSLALLRNGVSTYVQKFCPTQHIYSLGLIVM